MAHHACEVPCDLQSWTHVGDTLPCPTCGVLVAVEGADEGPLWEEDTTIYWFVEAITVTGDPAV
jgi:hypothetical protein